MATNISVDDVHNNKVLCLFIADLMEHDPLRAELANEVVLRRGGKIIRNTKQATAFNRITVTEKDEKERV